MDGLAAPLKFVSFCIGLLAVTASPAQTQHKATTPGRLHTYYIAADEVEWNFAPDPGRITLPWESEIAHAPPLSLKTYLKAVYHEYTDDSFQTLKPRPPQWEHLGILGPLIRAEVGDTVKVVFRNNTNLVTTMHPHGLAYDKDSEGALYLDGKLEADKKGDGVHAHETYTYTWTVPERAGPAPGDPSSVLWMYHSHFIETRDLNAGLMGPIIVTRKGFAKPDGSPKDVDREFVVAFAVFDESASGYFMKNLVLRGKTPISVLNDPTFRKAVTFYTLNGLTHGALPMLTMKKGERVRWYLLSNTNEEDVHTPHWHGATVVSNMMRTDTVSLGPMMMVVADMVPDQVGTWLFHCHVAEHFDGGMLGRFTVTP